jgi:hemoglobin-like flavoprotein
MNRIQAHRVRTSLKWFRPCGPALIARVLRNLGYKHPGVRALFPEDSAQLNKQLFDTLTQVVRSLPHFQRLEEPLMALGVKAAAAGANPAHYRIVRNELLSTMAELADVDWSEELAKDWALVLDAVAGVMLRGAFVSAEAA